LKGLQEDFHKREESQLSNLTKRELKE